MPDESSLAGRATRDARPVGEPKRHGRKDEGLLDHGGSWIFEPNKATVHQAETEQTYWLKFFNEGETLDDETLPEWMRTPVMRQAMGALAGFSEKDRA